MLSTTLPSTRSAATVVSLAISTHMMKDAKTAEKAHFNYH
jgi:hypothetical protein